MFRNLFKKPTKQNDLEIYAPLNGRIIPLTEVPDPVFNQKMMGEGIAIIPNEGKVISPVEGRVIHVSDTKHAVGLRANDGTEILIHVGLETVELKGEGFKVSVSVDDKVSLGDTLLDFDLKYIKENASDIVTPIVITNSKDGDKQFKMTDEKETTAGNTVIITVLAD